MSIPCRRRTVGASSGEELRHLKRTRLGNSRLPEPCLPRADGTTIGDQGRGGALSSGNVLFDAGEPRLEQFTVCTGWLEVSGWDSNDSVMVVVHVGTRDDRWLNRLVKDNEREFIFSHYINIS
jgi:hypothetical protein